MEIAACNSSSNGKYTAGTYTGTAKGHSSDVKVTATFSSTEITKVELDVSGETEAIGGVAAEELTKQIMEAQSADIDGVSGATETGNAVKAALEDAISQATGTAEENLIPRIIEAQSTGVDSITGATTSSGAIKTIVSEAIEEAGGKASQWNTAVEKSTEVKKLEGYDTIVVGLGGAGVLSYCAAADNCAKVFGIEAAGEIGGNSASVYGPMALNSKNLKDKYNNGEDYINADEVYKTWIDYVETDEKADVIKEAVYQSGTAVDYYMDNFDFSFDGMADY